MQLKKTIRKTKVIFQQTIHSLGSFLNREQQKIRRSSSLNLNLSNSTKVYEDFSEISEPHKDDKMMESMSNTTFTKEAINEKNIDFESIENCGEKPINEKEIKRDKKMGSYREGKGETCSKISRGGSYVLARKMRELEMTETSDVDQVLDIQEVLHCYSCLTSPSYLDIVDRFYIDMHSEFPLKKPIKSIGNSSRRLGPLKI